MKTAEELAKLRPIGYSETRCPHCRVDELHATDAVVTDTDQHTVRVWKCATCEYTEGRPDLTHV